MGRSKYYALIVAVLWLAFALRVFNLSSQSVWWDEAFTWQAASHGWANLWHTLQTGDRNPPLYFLSLMGWGGIAGWSEFSLRFLSVGWMMLGLAFTFNLTKRLYSTSAGLWTLTIAALSPALIVYAQEARMYAAFFALTAATLYLGVKVWNSEVRDRPTFLPFLVSEALLLLTHYFAIPLVAALNICALIGLLHRRARFRSFAKWIAGQVLVAVPLAMWTVIVFATPGSLINAQETPPNLFAFIEQVVILWLSGVRDLQGNLIALPWLALVILPVAVIGARRVNRRSTLWAVMFVGVSLLTAYLMTLMLTSFHPRYVLPFSVPIFVLLGAAVSALFDETSIVVRAHIEPSVTLLLAIGLVTVWGWATAFLPNAAKDDTRGVAQHLKNLAAADNVILQEANDYTLDYYDHGPAQTKMITATTEAEAFKQLSAALGNAKRVWLPHWKVSTQDPRGYWPFLLEQSGSLRWRPDFRGYDLRKYELVRPIQSPPLTLTVDSNGPLVRWSGIEGQGADGAFTFAVEWQPPVKLYEAAGVSMRLRDFYGETISSVDRRLLDEQGRTTDRWATNQSTVNYYVLPIPPGTPPLTYTLTAQLYTGRDVLSDQVLTTISLPRRSDDADPYRTLAGYHLWLTPAGAGYTDLVPGLWLEAVGDLSPQSIVPPLGKVEVVLQWRKVSNDTAAKPHLRLVHNNSIVAEFGSQLFEHDYPIAHWANGESIIERVRIEYPPLRGRTQLQVGEGDHWRTVADFQLDESALKFDAPAMQHAQSAQFGDMVELLGYDLKSTSLAVDRPLDLTLYWRATNTEPITTTYTVFTQLIAPDGHLVAQHDAPPNLPTTAWVPGQIVIDSHALKVVDPTYRGPAALIVGWYNSASVVRVPVISGSDFVTLVTPVEVVER